MPAHVPVTETGNYFPPRDGAIAAIDAGQTSSAWVAEVLGRRVVKVWNNVSFHTLAEGGVPRGTAGRIALPVSGDDAATKAVAMAVVEELGFDAVDAGSLAESWRLEPGTPVYATDLDAPRLQAALARTERPRSPSIASETFARLGKLPPDTTPPQAIAMIKALMEREYPGSQS